MIIQKGTKVQITANHHVTERNGVHHCFKIGEIVIVDYDIDIEKETPLLINKDKVKQFVKPDCFKLL